VSQTFPAAADLGPAHTGKSIGYRVLNLDRTTYSAFSMTGVSETIDGMGYYVKSGGAVGPDAGGYIVWGTSGTDIIEDEIAPSPRPSAVPPSPRRCNPRRSAGAPLAPTSGPTQCPIDAEVHPPC